MVRKSEPEIGPARKRTVLFPCEQENRSSSDPLPGPVWFLRVAPTGFSLSRYIKANSHAAGDWIRNESGVQRTTVCYWRLFAMTVFIRGALALEDNTVPECVLPYLQRMAVKFYNEANEYGYEAKCK